MFIKRLGTVKHRFKVQFFLGELRSNISLNGNIFVVIKRGIIEAIVGEHKQTSQSILTLDQRKTCNFKQQILTFSPVTMYYDEEYKKYQQKLGELRIIFKNQKNEKKLLGKIYFDLSQYINGNKESYTVTKKLQEAPQKVQISFQYQLFFKFIGQGSEVSQQKGGVREKRKGSLSKFTDFVQGIFHHKQTKQSQESSNLGTQPKNQEHTPPKKKEKIKQKAKITNIQQKNNSLTFQTPANQQNGYSDDQFDESAQNTGKSKNIVKMKNKRSALTDQQLDNDKNSIKSKKSSRTDHFDQKRHSQPTKQEIQQTQIFNSLFKKKEQAYNRTPTQNQSLRSQQTPLKPQKYEKDQNQSKTIQLLKIQLEKANRNHQQQVKKLLQQNQTLKNDKKKMKSQIKAMKQEISKIKDPKTEVSSSVVEPSESYSQLQAKINQLQKQKSQYLINIQSLKKKHKTQINKYQQLLQRDQSFKQDFDSSSKGELKRLKDELIYYKNKVQELNKQLNDKNKEINRLEQQNNVIGQQFEKVQSSLQKLKMKICQQLNQANDSGDTSLVETLMHLNDQYLK